MAGMCALTMAVVGGVGTLVFIPKPADMHTPPAATTPRDCRNSTSEDCGDFRWDPPPAENSVLMMTATVSTDMPVAGRPVEIHVFASDDAPNAPALATIDWGDGESQTKRYACVKPRQRFGRWDPPAKGYNTTDVTHAHVYEEPRTYAIRIVYATNFCGEGFYDPYGDSVTRTLTVTVAPAP
jgi:hypothetical protein